ncbi:MAG: hypothetical protein MJ187_02230 [Alphaproteobacteria bacterium]|nr:hypothetical protein [Alphaproteobacteria bacterium]
MIISNDIIYQIRNNISLWCDDLIDGPDLAVCTEFATRENIDIISVSPDRVSMLWPWVEKTNIKIATRLYLSSKSDCNTSDRITDIAKRINTVFKFGADIVQVFIKMSDFDEFITKIRPVYDDLFFNHRLSIAVDINEIESVDWENFYQRIENIGAQSLLFKFPTTTGNDSDFIGRMYAALNNYQTTFNFDIHALINGNLIQAEQLFRLTELIQPQILPNMRFFINWQTEMFKLS